MLLGLGVDLLSLPRLEALIARRGARRLADRICSSRELAGFESLPKKHADATTLRAQQLRFLAARWATKEAAYKSLPTWPRGWGWKNLDLSYSPRGKPLLTLLPPEGKEAEAIRRRAAREQVERRLGEVEAGEDVVTGHSAADLAEAAESGGRETAGGGLEGVDLMVSLSHDGDMVVAAVVAQRARAGAVP